MFEKKQNIDTEKQKKAERREKKAVTAKSVAKIIVIPFLITTVLVAAIYLAMDKLTTQEKLLKNVVVATGDIAVNEFIAPEEVEEYFAEIAVDSEVVSENAVTSLEGLKNGGFYVNLPIKKGQLIYSGDINQTNAKLDKYKSGYEVTSFAVSNFDKGVNGSLRRGAVIDVYAIDEATDQLMLFAENVYVAAAYDSSGNELVTDEGVAQSYTVYVKPDEVEKLNQAIHHGEIHVYQK